MLGYREVVKVTAYISKGDEEASRKHAAYKRKEMDEAYIKLYKCLPNRDRDKIYWRIATITDICVGTARYVVK